jgi:hypothetical protein
VCFRQFQEFVYVDALDRHGCCKITIKKAARHEQLCISK